VASFLYEVTEEGPESGESVAGVNVMLDDVEGEIVEPAETPHTNRQQYSNFHGRCFEDQQERGTKADDQKQYALELDQARVGEVFHGAKIGPASEFSKLQMYA